MKKMILVTDNFPYGPGESTFILPELKQLTQEFEVAIVSSGHSTERTSGLPADIGVYKCPKNKTSWAMGCFKSLFSPMFYRELRHAFRCAKHPFLALLQCMDYYGESESFARQFKAVVEAEGEPDIVYCYWHRPELFGVLRTRKVVPNAKIVSRAHGYDLYGERFATGYIPYKQECDALIDRVFLISKVGLEYYKKNYSVSDPPKYELAYLGTDNSVTAPWRNDPTTLRIFSCSNIVSVKRVHLIVEALEQLDDISVEWTHAGDGVLMEQLASSAASKLKGKDNIRYNFIGHVPNSALKETYGVESIDYFITVSETEGLPVSVMEACSFGIPIIATGVGGIPEIVGEDNGLLMPASVSPSDIADVLRRAAEIKQTEAYSEMRACSQQKWRDGFIATENAKKFTRRLLDICEK